MKSLVFLFAAVVLTAISVNLFAQTNTGLLPSVGSEHDYWVNATDETTQTSGIGNTYVWWISTDAADLVAQETPGTDFTVTNGTYAGTGGVNNFTIGIKWNPSAVGKTFYLVVEETDGTGCKNVKATAIQPTNNFKLEFVALESDGTTKGDNLSRCAPAITMSAAGTVISYNYGADNYMFKLTASDIYSSWSFVNTFANVIGTASATIEYKVKATGTWTPIASPITVPASATGTEEVFVRISLVNGTEEGTTAQTLQLTLSDVKDAGDNVVTEITDSTGGDITSAPVQKQTVSARPATTTIGFN
jgi:hypothetical protein